MRSKDRTTPLELLLAAFAGFAASAFAPGLYAAAVHVAHPPTSHQTVCEFALQAAGGLLVIQIMDAFVPTNYLRLARIPRGLILGIAGSIVVMPLVLFATFVVQEMMLRYGAPPAEEHPLLLVFRQPGNLDRLLVVLSAVILAPLFEEMVFRAHLQAAIRRLSGMPWLAICTTSVLFALVHGIWWMMPPLFVLAMGLGYVYDRSQNLWANITMHALFNALSLTIEYISIRHH